MVDGQAHSQFQKAAAGRVRAAAFSSLLAIYGLARRYGAAGWSSPVARQAHNLKVVGSNPTPATTINSIDFQPRCLQRGFFAFWNGEIASQNLHGPMAARLSVATMALRRGRLRAFLLRRSTFREAVRQSGDAGKSATLLIGNSPIS